MTNTHTGDIPPPHFINSVDELRGFSAALTAFLHRYDELHDHISFINSAIDSKLPNHVLCSVNPNQSAVTSFVGTSYGHTITAVLEDIVTELNPKAIATATTTCERRHAIARKPESPNFTKKIEESDTLMKSVEIDTSKKHLETDISKKLKEINVSKKALETDFSSKPEETDTSKKLLETDFSKKSEEIDVLNKPVEINVLKKHEEIEVSEKLEEIDVQINPEEIDESKKHVEIDESTNSNQSAVSSSIETSCGHTITDVLEDTVSELNPKATATATTACERRHVNARKLESANFTKKVEESDTLMKSVEIDTSKKPEELDVSKKLLETDFSKKPEEINVWKKPEEINVSKKLEEIDVLKKPEEIFVSKKSGEIKVLKIAEKIDESKEPGNFDLAKKPEEINVWKKPQEINVSKKPEEIDILKKPEEIFVSKKPGEIEVLKIAEEIDESKEPGNFDLAKKPEEINVSKKVKKTNILKNPEEFNARKKLLKTDIWKKPEEIHQPKKLEKTDNNSKKNIELSKLQFLCKTMNSHELKTHIAKHFPELNKRPNEIAKALKLAIDPAKLVLKSIGRFFLQGTNSYTKSSSQNNHIASRRASVLILECFVMISGDGIKISKEDLDNAAQAAFDWRKRAIKEGGLRYMHEDDAKGLLLLISGFGILDRVFKIEDIRDLIRVCNHREICSALRRSSVLMPRIPEVVDMMVKNNLEIEAADIAFTFGLEDKCHPETILTNFLHNKIEEFRNGSRFQPANLRNAAMRQHLSDLKSVRKCLEDHKVDPSKLFPNFKINEKIQLLKKVIDSVDSKSTGEKSTLKRKAKESEFSKNANYKEAKRSCYSYEDMPNEHSPVVIDGLDSKSTREKSTLKRKAKEFEFSKNANYQEAKRSCYSYEDMPNEHSPVDHYGTSQYDRSTYFDRSPVARGLAGSCYGGLVADPMVHTAKHRPYDSADHSALVDKYIGQPYLRESQTYDSHPSMASYHGRPLRRSPLESFPSPPGGGFGRRDPSLDLYGFADKVVENESYLVGRKRY